MPLAITSLATLNYTLANFSVCPSSHFRRSPERFIVWFSGHHEEEISDSRIPGVRYRRIAHRCGGWPGQTEESYSNGI